MRDREFDPQAGDDLFEDICTPERGVHPDILRETLTLAIELAREGREGRKVGTMFVIADSDEVLRHSKPLILDPLWCYPPEKKRIADDNARETVKELSQLDGAFVVSDDGIVLSATRYINASSQGIDLPLGLGSRHMAAASITRETQAVAVVVSESAIVRVFDDGQIISEIIPELWLLRRYSLHLTAPYRMRSDTELAVVSKADR
jgi:DNA integrity scanning protein DisA with diadenylate cyclase activity